MVGQETRISGTYAANVRIGIAQMRKRFDAATRSRNQAAKPTVTAQIEAGFK